MEKQIKFFRAEIRKTSNWKEGEPRDKSAKKTLGMAIFYSDGDGTNSYVWVPEKWETNLLIAIARVLVKAEDLNFPLLINPEPRPDIEELRKFLNPE